MSTTRAANLNRAGLSTSAGNWIDGGQSDTATQFIGYGALDSISFSLDFVNLTSDASWAADVAILIQPPGNPCYAFGGFNLDSNCVSVGDWQVVWPEWANAASGTYMVTLSLESFNIDGDGLWSINVLNGFTGSGGVDYTLDATLYGVCPPGPNDDVFGCTDALACNFNPFATTDDASCYPCGCTYPNACNYNPDALEDDGSCLYPVDLGVCDCAGSIEDALGVCGGTCDQTKQRRHMRRHHDASVLDACGIPTVPEPFTNVDVLTLSQARAIATEHRAAPSLNCSKWKTHSWTCLMSREPRHSFRCTKDGWMPTSSQSESINQVST